MKICKNCGRQTEDSKIRCPHCGYLFEEDIDSVLRKMKSNLNTYKNEVVSMPVQPGAAAEQKPQAAPEEQKERFELLAEVAQLKGEVKALHGEIDRIQAARQVPYGGTAPVAVPVQQPVTPTLVYTQPVYGMATAPSALPTADGKQAKPTKHRGKFSRNFSINRIVIATLCVLLLGFSFGAFFFNWTDGAYAFRGFDGIEHFFLFHFKSSYNVKFLNFLSEVVRSYDFSSNATLTSICQTLCYNLLLYGIPLYFLVLLLSFPLLLSVFGRISMKGWHLFMAWVSFLMSLMLFGVLCWVGQFTVLTAALFVGMSANFVRAVLLGFFKGKMKLAGGLQ